MNFQNNKAPMQVANQRMQGPMQVPGAMGSPSWQGYAGYQRMPSGMYGGGLGFPMGGFGSPMVGWGGLGSGYRPFMGGMGFTQSPWSKSQLPSGFAQAPQGVPFQQNVYNPFGSGFGLGLGFWNSGFGRGPQFPEGLWSRPSPEQSPQGPVAPAAPAAPAAEESRGTWQDYVDAYRQAPGYSGPGSEVESPAPNYAGYQRWLAGRPAIGLM